MRILQLVLTLFAFLFSVARAWHNVTYDSKDPALIYQPTGSWTNWPPNGCLSWPQGQWTTKPGTITLYFEGVAVSVYGLFDDSINPIYTVQVDEDTPTKLGFIAPTDANRCEPLYSKTGMAWSKHRFIFNLTNERPYDVKDLSFQGFIVTVPDNGDGITFDTTIPYSNLTSTAPGPATTTSRPTSTSTSSSSSGLSATITKISSIVGTIIFCLIAACCVWGCIRGCCSGIRKPRVSPRPLIGNRNQSLPLQRRANENDNAFQPPPPPYEPSTRTVPNTPSPFSPFTPTPLTPTPAPVPNPPPPAPMPVPPPPIFSPPATTPKFESHTRQSSIFSGASTTPAGEKLRRASSLSGNSSKPYAGMDTKQEAPLSAPVYNPTFPMPRNTTATTTNPANRPQSPAWNDSSEVLD